MARGVALGAGLAIAVLVANGLATTTPGGERATLALAQTHAPPKLAARVTARISPASATRDAAWVSVTAWQGRGKLVVDRLTDQGGGLFRGTERIPLHGDWKAVLRVQRGRKVIGAPVYMPSDPAIPAKGIPARAHVTRPFILDHQLLQRERKKDIPTWLWTAACLVVLTLGLGFFAALASGVARVARRDPRPPAQPPRAQRGVTARTPATA